MFQLSLLLQYQLANSFLSYHSPISKLPFYPPLLLLLNSSILIPIPITIIPFLFLLFQPFRFQSCPRSLLRFSSYSSTGLHVTFPNWRICLILLLLLISR
ncbi:hypothetical protein OIU74_013880 [Salix koriyanagi]|uniref:Uncharacterized protein n=1 Tax=Salix koriyanagi TaxID=2511006 RepID=A0A9Q0SZB2_9ROSI|nr:hypothetical protein OIU74_013880 [Salix koriyanagi]